MSSFLYDLRYGWRLLRRSPGFTLIAVLTLALGIGANATIFTVVNAVFLRPLPFPESERLMVLFHAYTAHNIARVTVSPSLFAEYREQLKSFEHLGAFTGWQTPQNLTGRGVPQRVQTVAASAGFFPSLGVEPILGRAFVSEDEAPGTRVAVLSHGLWQSLFAGDRAVLEQTVSLDGQTYQVVGVMPAHFRYPSTAELWVPIALTPQQWQSGTEFLNVVGRLAPGVTPEQAAAELTAMTADVRARIEGAEQAGWSVYGESLRHVMVGNVRPAVLVLLAAVACVLLIACANIANLLLVRAASRGKEMAIRAALGASRLRVMRQLLAEGVLLALLGGAAGLLLGYWGVDILLALVPIQLPASVPVAVDQSVLLFTFSLAVLTGIFFGLAPGWQLSRGVAHDALKEGGRTSMSGGRHFLQKGLVAAEVALAIMLLIAAGLMVRSFAELQRVDLGFDEENVLTFALSLPPGRYQGAAQTTFHERVLEQISTLPGVQHAGAGSSVPLMFGWGSSLVLEGRQDITPNPHVNPVVASPGYFPALRISVRQGRHFEDSDTASSVRVALVDENFVRAYFPDENPIGRRLAFGFEGEQENPAWREIVGVVAPVKPSSEALTATTRKGQVYMPMAQFPLGSAQFVLRTSGDPSALAAAVRREVLAVDPEQPIHNVSTMSTVVSEAVAQPRFNMVLLVLFAALALLLAIVGLYGVVSYTVTQRSYEFGVRMALGARPGQVLALVLSSVVKLAAIGLVVGVVLTVPATRALSGMLFGVRPTDPLTYLVLAVLLVAVVLVASYLPARRATQIDPAIALRSE